MMDWPFGDLIPGAYGVIVADPPWKFRTWSDKGDGRACPYPTMTIEEIAALPVADLAARDCLLAMWTTAPFLTLSLDVMRAWGFRYSTMGSWAKLDGDGDPSIGTGFYWRSSAEPWLVGIRGQPGRVRGLAIPNSILAPRREHSRKPDRLHTDLEAMYPQRRKCELFGRAQRAGWDVWGNESTKFSSTPSAECAA
ncbi:hypothetical protein [Azospirillum argentinense]|uniref:MT-A70 family methyltransferase n=1 Tax=Azospirillum argentinense TaxID=2970906 RepID=UPI0032DE40BE